MFIQGALEDVEAALAIDASYVSALTARALIRASTGAFDVRTLNESRIKTKPMNINSPSPVLAGCMLLRRPHLPASEASFLETVPDRPLLHCTTVTVCLRQEALSDCDAALALQPSDLPSMAIRGSVKRMARDYQV